MAVSLDAPIARQVLSAAKCLAGRAAKGMTSIRHISEVWTFRGMKGTQSRRTGSLDMALDAWPYAVEPRNQPCLTPRAVRGTSSWQDLRKLKGLTVAESICCGPGGLADRSHRSPKRRAGLS